MGNYIVARALAVIPTLLVLLLFVVVLVRLLPGNAVDILLAENAQASDVTRSELEHRLGLDKSLPAAYLDYTAGAIRGDLGRSLWSREPVTDIVFRKLPVTLELSVLALALGATSGVTIGVISAARQNSVLDYVLRSISIAGLSIPNFALATAVVVLPSIWWGWSPSLIYTAPSDGLWAHISQFFVPALVLSFGLSATLMRIARTTMLDVLRMDYIRTARSKGLRERRVITKHALQNAMIPVVSLLGVQIAFLLSGTVIIENIFALPGIGREMVSSLGARDYPVIQGLTLVSGLLVIIVNLAVDVSYGLLDPRTRTR